LTEPRVVFEVLPNGLTVLIRESRAAAVAEVQVWARVGSADEREDELGLAHFHEHMLFKGTRRRGVGEIAGEIEGVGGRINAFTSLDATVYHATVPSSEVGAALDVLVDAVRESSFDPAEIAREIEVVLEEIRRAADSPSQVLGEAVLRERYRVHPYRRPILGSPESVASFDRERVTRFFRRWYRPDNLMLVAAGDLDAQDLLASVRAAFADAEPGAPPHARPAEPPQRDPRAFLLRTGFDRTSFEIAWPSVPFAHADTPYLDLLAFILGECESSRLVRRVKERLGLVDRIDAWSYTPLEAGVFAVSADADAERIGEAIAAVAEEVERLRDEPVAPGELEMARVNFLATQHFERESVSGLARKLGTFQQLTGDFRSEGEYFAAIRRATPEDLQRVAATHLHAERTTLGVLMPEQAATGLTAAWLAESVQRGAAHARRAHAPVSLPHKGDVACFRLPNGAELFVARRPEIPVVAVRASLLGGLLAEDEKTAGLTSFTTGMWLRGTRRRSAEGLASAIESIAADLDGFSGRNSLGLTLEVTSDQLDPALDLVAEVLLEPAFDLEELERERRDVLALLKRREDRLAELAFDLFQRTHYPDHPYRFPLVGTPESVAGFSVESLAAHHERLVRGRNLVIGVAGDVEPEALAEALARRLADLDDAPFDPIAPPPPARPASIQEAVLRKDRAQAHLVLGFRGLTVADPDRFTLEVVAQVLAGQSGRLFLELRDRQGLAYSVTATNVEGVAPGFFSVYIGTSPEKLDDARRGILAELRRLRETAPSDDELRRAQRHLAGSFAIDLQRAATRAAHLSLDALYGLGADADRSYTEKVLAVTKEDVLRVARRVIDLDAYTLAVVRP
jgi:zinc protease